MYISGNYCAIIRGGFLAKLDKYAEAAPIYFDCLARRRTTLGRAFHPINPLLNIPTPRHSSILLPT